METFGESSGPQKTVKGIPNKKLVAAAGPV